MGGWGSTRWRDHTPASLVEDFISADLPRMVKSLPVEGWWHRRWSARQHSVHIKASLQHHQVVLRFNLGRGLVRQAIRLTTTRPHLGGVRWWVRCPHCEIRRRLLYLHPALKAVACRSCLGLTYWSRQTSDARVRELRRQHRAGNSHALVAALIAADSRSILARRALELEGVLSPPQLVPASRVRAERSSR
jgi:hypothetical protein